MPDPLEQFLLEYVDAAGGLADAIEPQVYDVLLPNADTPLRVAFDPDALPEHASAQLLTFGSALLDDWLEQAQARGRVGLAYLDDLHLTPHALDQRVRRELVLPEGLALQIETMRPRYVTHSLFWFEVTYISDEKEQALYPVAVERYYGRQVRYLDALLESERFSEIRRWHYPDAASLPLDHAYLAAREAVARTVRAEAHTRQHQNQQRLVEQTGKMQRYYADLRAELAERVEKATARGEELEALRLRQAALAREEALRLDELERKSQLRVQLKLTNLLHVKIPRLFVNTRLVAVEGKRAAFRPTALTLTWDPLVEKTDALTCPGCHHPTFELRLGRQNELRCPNCETPTGKR
jgi:hypothetical protein